jgi:hypothetical protein
VRNATRLASRRRHAEHGRDRADAVGLTVGVAGLVAVLTAERDACLAGRSTRDPPFDEALRTPARMDGAREEGEEQDGRARRRLSSPRPS